MNNKGPSKIQWQFLSVMIAILLMLTFIPDGEYMPIYEYEDTKQSNTEDE